MGFKAKGSGQISTLWIGGDMMFTTDKVAIDFQSYAYTLIGGGIGLLAIIGLIAMIIFIYVQLIK